MIEGGGAANIVAQLRALADRIESGEDQAQCVLVLVEEDAFTRPQRYLWGESRSAQHTAGMCLVAANRFLGCSHG